MNEEMKSSLNQIFQDYTIQRKIYQSEQEKLEREQINFIKAFEQCCQVVIRPVLEEYVSFLQDQGHRSEIKQVEQNTGRYLKSAIGIDIIPCDQIGLINKKDIFAYPLRFVANQDKRQIEIEFGCNISNRNSQDQIPRNFRISDVNRAVVERALLIAISCVFQVVQPKFINS